jgi:hypothetical protein
MKRSAKVVVVCGGVLAIIGSITGNVASTIYGCFLMAVIVWGDR